MGEITVVGSITPCVELGRGQYWTGPHSDHVQRLIDLGCVNVVKMETEVEADEPTAIEVEATETAEEDSDDVQPKRTSTKKAAKGDAAQEDATLGTPDG